MSRALTAPFSAATTDDPAPESALGVPSGRRIVSRRALLRAAAGLAGIAALAAAGCGEEDDPIPVSTSTGAFPRQDILATPEWVAAQTGHPHLRLLDCAPIRRYRDGHLPGATHVWWQDTIEIHNPVYGMLTGAAGRQEIARETGVTPESPVVCYDERGGQHAARLVWVLRASGVRQARLLDGGRQAWRAAGRDLTRAGPNLPEGEISNYLDEELLAHGAAVAERLGAPDLVVLDTRRDDERRETWYGRLRRGAIPGSHWLPRERFLTDDGLALDHPDELRARLALAGLPPAAPDAPEAPDVIVYGLHGSLACLPWVALQALGYPKVRVYDGSWAEWGANEAWPVEPLPDSP